jgi:hypothetical protein
LDESAVLACVAYVNFNLIRANMPSTPEELSCRSIQKRIPVIKQQNNQPYQIMPFVGNLREDIPKGINYSLRYYYKLVDTTGRCIRGEKSGYTYNREFPIITKLELFTEQLLTLTTKSQSTFLCSRERKGDATISNPHSSSKTARDGQSKSVTQTG